jgi:hypothetical protein
VYRDKSFNATENTTTIFQTAEVTSSKDMLLLKSCLLGYCICFVNVDDKESYC